jgi:hypothetical protein
MVVGLDVLLLLKPIGHVVSPHSVISWVVVDRVSFAALVMRLGVLLALIGRLFEPWFGPAFAIHLVSWMHHEWVCVKQIVYILVHEC